MKIGIYNPYFDSFGGGERYILTLAEHWSKMHTVSVFWNDSSLLQESEERFNLDLSRVNVVSNFFATGNVAQKWFESSKYDLIVFLSDGSIPMSFARYNILHFQVPFAHVKMVMWKAGRYQRIVCNSEFTKNNLDPHLTIPKMVIYPPVDVEKFKIAKKSKTILTVGRFNGLYGAKKHDVLIAAFREVLKKKQFLGWKLLIAGGVLPSDIPYFEKIQQLGNGLQVEFHPNCSFSELTELYSTASIYWHAAGYNERNPEQMEHFGITTVEAMASGCVPLVYAGGGQTDIVKDGVNGYVWTTIDQLLQKTMIVMKDSAKRKIIVREAKKTSTKFSKEQFTKSFDSLLSNICNKI